MAKNLLLVRFWNTYEKEQEKKYIKVIAKFFALHAIENNEQIEKNFWSLHPSWQYENGKFRCNYLMKIERKIIFFNCRNCFIRIICIYLFMLLVLYIFIKYILEPRQISKMEISAKRTKDLQSLFAFAKNSIPEVSHVLIRVIKIPYRKFPIYKLKQKRV